MFKASVSKFNMSMFLCHPLSCGFSGGRMIWEMQTFFKLEEIILYSIHRYIYEYYKRNYKTVYFLNQTLLYLVVKHKYSVK